MVTRKNQLLLRFLRIRVIVNGRDIYPLRADEPVYIQVEENNPTLVISDGYHFTRPVELVYHHLHTYYFKVVCVIGDVQLLAAFLLVGVLYLAGFYTGFLVLQLLSFAPILYFLFFYYINRREFLQITPV